MDTTTMVFQKCFCCSKNRNMNQLVEINSNTVTIGEDSINFRDLLLDCCFCKIDSNKPYYICDDCRVQLVTFHMFKRDVKQYRNFADELLKLELLIDVDVQLNILLDTEKDLQVSKHENVIIISSPEETLVLSDVSNKEELPENTSIELMNTIESEPELEMFEENVDHQNSSQVMEEYLKEEESEPTETEFEEETQPVKEEIIIEDIEPDCNEIEYSEQSIDMDYESDGQYKSKRRRYHYKSNTDDKLTDEQRDWIRKEVLKSEVLITNDDGTELNAFKCTICNTILRISGSMKKHYRDIHILKSNDELQKKDSQKAFKEEITGSKITVETENGTEVIWKCQRCPTDRIFRSVQGLKVHIRYTHIRAATIDAAFIASCRTTIETENSTKDAWKCPQCSKILRSRDACRNHLKLEHPQMFSSASDGNRSDESSREETMGRSNQSSNNKSLITLLQNRRRNIKDCSSTSCDSCGINFINGTTKKEKSTAIHLECHKILSTIASSFQLLKCELCKMMFLNDEELSIHATSHDDSSMIQQFQSDGLPFLVGTKFKDSLGTALDLSSNDISRCGYCPALFNYDDECNAHIMILHSTQLMCPLDNLEFSGTRGMGQFNIHMKNKHPELFPDIAIICTYCEMEFSTVYEKLAHMKTCNAKKFHCTCCTRKFFKKTDLIRHMKLISGEISYTCAICSKQCQSTMDLKLHERSHSNDIRTYVCTYENCGKAYKTPAARSAHMENHAEGEYNCQSCERTFKKRVLYKRHMKRHNPNEVLTNDKNDQTYEAIYVEEEMS